MHRLIPPAGRALLRGAMCVVAAAACQDRRTPVEPARPASPTAPAAQAAGPRVIPDFYIVRFRDDVRDIPGEAGRLARSHGGRIEHVYQRALRGFSVRLSAQAAAALERNPRVLSVRAAHAIELFDVQSSPPWGLDRIDQVSLPLDNTYTYGGTGSNYTAYVFDTGILTTHDEFGGRATTGWTVPDDRGGIDCGGHGTHVAGTIGGATYGVAKQVRLVSVRVFGYADCSGTDADLIAGIEWVIANKQLPAVANMSLGFGVIVADVDIAVSNLIASGVAVVVAAGNTGADACRQSPARVPEAVTVAASDQNDARSIWFVFSMSNYGRCVDLFAPGTNILSAGIESNSASLVASGTSMAAPHVAGAIALTQEPASSDAVSRVLANATPNKISNAGTGTPNLLLNANLVPACAEGTCPPTPATDPRLEAVSAGGPYAGIEGSPVEFAIAGPPDPALTYEWSFDDGTTASGPTATHTFADNGSFVVRVTARDAADPANYIVRAAKATIENVPPVVDAGPDATAYTGALFRMAGSFTDAGVKDGKWRLTIQWGDGAASSGSAASVDDLSAFTHTYTAPGTFTVRATVTDKDGGIGADETVVSVLPNDPPTAMANGPYLGNEGTAIQFSSTGSADPNGQAVTYVWTFGDGTSSTAASPRKAYADNGEYTVTLTVRDASGATATSTATATVANVPPLASFSVPAGVEGSGYKLALAGNDPGNADDPTLEYRLDCGQGGGWTAWSTTVKAVDCPIVPDQTTLTVHGEIRDKDGGATLSTKTLTVRNAAPVVTLAATTPTSVDPGTTVAVEGSFTDVGLGDRPWSYTINWGDGTQTTTGTATEQGTLIAAGHVYTKPGTWYVTLNVRDKDAGSGTSARVTVGVSNTGPVAKANGPYTGTEGTGIQFSSAGSADPEGLTLSYSWSFGDGTASTAANPKKTYSDNGTYTVTLTVKDPSGATATSTTIATVDNVAPTAALATGNTYEGTAYIISMSGTDVGAADRPTLEYQFDCGQGAGWTAWSTAKSTTCPALPDQQAITVQGQVRDKELAATLYVKAVSILNSDPVVTLTAMSPVTFQVGGTLSVQGNFTDKGLADGPWTYTISWGDGTVSITDTVADQAEPITASHLYAKTGTFAVYLTVRDNDGGAARARITVTVVP